MKLTLQVESSKHKGVEVVKPVARDNRDLAKTRLHDAWRQANQPGLSSEERQRRLNWLGGAIVVYALFTGEDPHTVRAEVEASSPPVTSVVEAALPTFREGRSTPPPPRHPGAQVAVE